MSKKRLSGTKQLRIIVLMHESLIPPDSLEGYTDEEMLEWKTEFDVVTTLREIGHQTYEPVCLENGRRVEEAKRGNQLESSLPNHRDERAEADDEKHGPNRTPPRKRIGPKLDRGVTVIRCDGNRPHGHCERTAGVMKTQKNTHSSLRAVGEVARNHGNAWRAWERKLKCGHDERQRDERRDRA